MKCRDCLYYLVCAYRKEADTTIVECENFDNADEFQRTFVTAMEVSMTVADWFDERIDSFKEMNRKAELDGDKQKFEYSFTIIENLKIFRELLLGEIDEKHIRGTTDES